MILGLGFLLLAAGSLKRLVASAGQRGSEAVITTFYSLIFFTSVVRAVWFLIPKEVRVSVYWCARVRDTLTKLWSVLRVIGCFGDTSR